MAGLVDQKEGEGGDEQAYVQHASSSSDKHLGTVFLDSTGPIGLIHIYVN